MDTFEGSLSFLINSMIVCGSEYISSKHTKPGWMTRTEAFHQLFTQARKRSQEDPEKNPLNGLKKLTQETYDRFSVDLIQPIIQDGKVNDEFLKIRHDYIPTEVKGLAIQTSKQVLPIAEAYTAAVKLAMANPDNQSPYPSRILYGMYSVFLSGCTLSDDERSSIQKNVDISKEIMENCDEPDEEDAEGETPSGPFGMLQNMMKNFDMKSLQKTLSETMTKLTQNENAMDQFKEVSSHVLNEMGKGKNPLDLLKEMAEKGGIMDANFGMPTESTETDTSEPQEREIAVLSGQEEEVPE